MADAKLEDVKKEIRSLLISYQKGTSLSEFRTEYRSMIGRWLPFKDFGFNDEYSFLKSMPDVVKLFPSPVPGDYHLFGIADESVKHIQKMICKQKASKHKTRYRPPRKVSYAYSAAPSYASNYGSSRPTYSNNPVNHGRYEVPPRFIKKELPPGVDQLVVKMLKNYPSGVKLSQFLDVFCDHYKRELKFRDFGFSTLEECLETIPGITAKNRNNNIIVHLMASNSPPKPPVNSAVVKQETVSKNKNNHSSTNHSQTSLISNTPDFFDRDFNRNENKSCVSAPSHNFLIDRMIEDSHSQSALQKNEDFEEPLQPEDPAKVSSTPASLSSKCLSHNDQDTFKSSKADLLDDFPLPHFKDNPTSHLLCDNFKEPDNKYLFAFDSPFIKEPENSASGVSRFVRNNLTKMMDKYPHGIFAVHFSDGYERLTGTPFDLHSLGFNNLEELVDAVPDIMMRKPLKGSKKDWIIYSAKSHLKEAISESGPAEVNALLFVENVILKIRQILQANSEGVPLNNFIHHYSINCTEPLYIRDLGFDNLENFLLSIASRVPLQITLMDGEKVVMLSSFQETTKTIKPPVSPLLKPTGIAPLDSKLKPYELPSDFDFSKYYPVYTSSIAHPGLVYIQFIGEETSDALTRLSDELNVFYNGEFSDLYRMKPADIKPNVYCIALWPSDKLWYRARIRSIVSVDFVQVFYEDYGTTDEIPMTMLRYIKEEHMALPVQALKSRLAFLEPTTIPGQATPSWDKRIRKRMLDLCQDKLLMAKIENICNGVLAVIICDTSGDADLFINDVLINENLAVVCGESDEPEQQVPPATPDPNMLQPHTIMLQFMKFMASNPTLANQLQNLSLNDPTNPMPFGFAPQQSLPPMCQQFPNISPLVNPNFNTVVPSFGNSVDLDSAVSIPPPKYPPGLNIQSPKAAEEDQKTTDLSELSPLNPSPPLTPLPDDEEVFDDDDDEYFEQLCQKNINAKKRFVKRVKTTDGYVFHVLLFDSQPYISSGDISILIWHAKNPSYLFHKLQAQEIELASMTLMENGNEEFFSQLERFKVKGVEKMGSESSILLYPLSRGNQILNLFGHPSATLRAKINTEIKTFNPLSSHWQELPDSEIPEELENVPIVTDDDKMNRLCLYDLKTMREGIRCKRLKLVKRKEVEKTNPDLDEEINKLNQLSNKVRERIIEIDQIISTFSERKR